MNGRGADVFLVDDDANDVAVAMRAFRMQGLDGRVRVFRDGAELLDHVDRIGVGERSPRLILLDLKMPRVDGRAALRALRERSATRFVPVVVVSSSDRHSDVIDCYALGANSFVVKRPDPHAPGAYLVETVRYWLDRNESAS